jgi:hypothetical protein
MLAHSLGKVFQKEKFTQQGLVQSAVPIPLLVI